METYKLYDGKIELVFEDSKHTYKANGEIVPGVTGVLGVIAKPALMYWAVNMGIEYLQKFLNPGVAYDEIQIKTLLEGARTAHKTFKENAGDIGSLVHEAIETYIKTGVKTELFNEKAKVAFDNFLKWQKDNNVKFIDSERKIYSKKYKYAGTMDFSCIIDGKYYVGDTKTSSGIWDEYWFQVASYQQALTEETGQEVYGRVIVRVGKDGSFDVQTKVNGEYEKDINAFLGALALHKRIQEMKDESNKLEKERQ